MNMNNSTGTYAIDQPKRLWRRYLIVGLVIYALILGGLTALEHGGGGSTRLGPLAGIAHRQSARSRPSKKSAPPAPGPGAFAKPSSKNSASDEAIMNTQSNSEACQEMQDRINELKTEEQEAQREGKTQKAARLRARIIRLQAQENRRCGTPSGA